MRITKRSLPRIHGRVLSMYRFSASFWVRIPEPKNPSTRHEAHACSPGSQGNKVILSYIGRPFLKPNWLTNQPTSQLTNQLINYLTNKPTSQPTKQTNKQIQCKEWGTLEVLLSQCVWDSATNIQGWYFHLSTPLWKYPHRHTQMCDIYFLGASQTHQVDHQHLPWH